MTEYWRDCMRVSRKCEVTSLTIYHVKYIKIYYHGNYIIIHLIMLKVPMETISNNNSLYLAGVKM